VTTIDAALRGAQLVERALALSRADGCVVLATESSGANLRWANNTLTTNGESTDRAVRVISIVGRSFGAASATRVDSPERLADLVRAAETAAQEAGAAEDFGELIAPGSAGSAADFALPGDMTSTAVFRTVAVELGEAFAAAKADDRRLYGFVQHDVTTSWLGTSTGLRRRHVQPVGTAEFTAKDAGPRGSVWHGQATRDFTDVSVPATDALLRRRLAWSARPVDLPAGRYPVVLPPPCLADLMIYLYWSAAGRDAADGRSAFSAPHGGTRVGERLGPPGLVIAGDPTAPGVAVEPFVMASGSSATSSVFDNGLPLGRTEWVSDGVLSALVETRASAGRRQVPVTPFIDNLIVDAGGSAGVDDLVAVTERGLLLTSLWYIREVDPQTLLLTGLTRDGVYLVEGGEVVGAVNNFRFNESPIDLLGRLAEVGRSVPAFSREWGDYFPWTRMPAVVVPDFHMSSVSPAS
jgi:predicted Zn-dependent protease